MIDYFHVDFRCDSAKYFTGSPHACVQQDVIPHLQYKNEDTGEIQAHIKKAQDSPDKTFPKTGDIHKLIPGKWTGDPSSPGLTRIPTQITEFGITKENPQYTANHDRATAACDSTGEFAGKGLPERPNRPKYHCDEYPFASTNEGAASTSNDFSVESIIGTQNTKAGGQLGVFFDADRILYGEDTFYVQVGDCETCDPWTSPGNDSDLPGLQPISTPERILTAQDYTWERRYGGAIVGTGLYYARGADVVRYDLKTKIEAVVKHDVLDTQSSYRPTVLAAYKNYLILADEYGVYTYDLGTGQKHILLAVDVYRTAAMNNGHLFINTDQIYEIDLTGMDWNPHIISTGYMGSGIGADGSSLWWIERQEGYDGNGEYFARNVLRKLDRASGESSLAAVIPTEIGGSTIYSSGDYLYAVGSSDRYWSDDELFRIDKTTGQVDLVSDGFKGIYGIVSDGTYLYVIDGGLSRIDTPAE